MALQKPTIVLFDMDGTTIRHIHPKLLTLLEALDDTGYKAAKYFSRVFRRKIQPPRLVTWEGGQRRKLPVHRALHRLRRRPVEEIVEPCPGIYGILNALRDAQIPVGLISNGLGKGYGHDILKKFELAQFFNVTLFREDIRRPKPHPDPILRALEQMPRKVSATDVVWFFGDRRKDVQAAVAARAHLPCAIEPFAYNLHAAIAVLEGNIGTDHIIMGWPDFEPKLKALLNI